MATKIRLMRLGKIRAPYYRIVVADARTKPNGKVIETIGKYHPKQEPSLIEVNSERAQYWLSVGAQPTQPVLAILKLTGDWQRAAGKPTESRVKAPDSKPDHATRYETEAAAALQARTEQEKTTQSHKPEKKSHKKASKTTKGSSTAAEQPAES